MSFTTVPFMFPPTPDLVRHKLSSLTYTLKRKRDKTPTWRTPFVTLNFPESVEPHLTYFEGFCCQLHTTFTKLYLQDLLSQALLASKKGHIYRGRASFEIFYKLICMYIYIYSL